MKTIIILSIRQIEFVLDFIRAYPEFRYVLVYSNDEEAAVKSRQLNSFFDAAYQVRSDSKKNILTTYNYDDLTNIVEKELALLKKQSLSREMLSIFTQDESNTYTAARLRTQFGLNGVQEKEIINFRNKKIMKDKLETAGLRVPKNKLIEIEKLNDHSNYYKALVSALGSPFIIKPIDSAGSDGVYKIMKEHDFSRFIKERYNTDEIYEVEEFIQGKFYHVDAVIYNKNLYFAYACEHIRGQLGFQQGETIGSFCLPLDSKISQKLIKFMLQCLDVLGASEGCYHTEVFIEDSSNAPVFLESAARAPGLDTNRMYFENFGISMPLLSLYLITGKKPSVNYPFKVKKYSFWACIPKQEGTVISLNEPALISPYALSWNVKVGDKLTQAASNLDFAGSLFVSNDDLAVIKHDFETVRYFKGINTRR